MSETIKRILDVSDEVIGRIAAAARTAQGEVEDPEDDLSGPAYVDITFRIINGRRRIIVSNDIGYNSGDLGKE